MRKELKIIGSRDRHVFTATFIRFGFRDGYKGPVKTILLQDVLLDDKIVTDHLWFDLTKGFESADLLPGDVVEFCARVSIYEKGYKGYRNDVFDRPIENEYAGTVKLTNLDNGESNISFPSCDDGLIINPADKHIK